MKRTIIISIATRLGEKLHLKLSDFGMARTLDEDGCFMEEDVKKVKLPIAWTAPEALSTGCFNTKTEIVSCFLATSISVILFSFYASPRGYQNFLHPQGVQD